MTNSDLEKKLHNYLGYLEADPHNSRLIIDTAQLHLRLGRLNEAGELIAQGQKNDPENAEFEFINSTIAMASNRPDKAIEILRNMLSHGVDNGGIRYNLAYSLALQGEMEEAQTVLEPKLAEISTQTPEVSILLARVKHYLSELSEGIQLIKTFLFENPNHPRVAEAQGVLALLYLDEEELSEARTFAKLSLASGTSYPESLITLGSIALSEIEPVEATQHFEQVLAKQNTNGRAWLGKGLSAMLHQDMTTAEQALLSCVEHMPSHLGSWNTLAWCQIAMQKIDEAEQTLNKAMDIDRNFSETHGGLAVIALFRGQTETAKEHIKRALGLNKNSFSGNYAQSILLANNGKENAAQEIVAQLMQAPIGKQKTTITTELQKFAAKNKASYKQH